MIGEKFLKFRCTGCGNCCKEPLLPLTDADMRRIIKKTGEDAASLVSWVEKAGIDMDSEPEAFVMLRQGKRVMVLKHERGGCRYLGEDNRCTIYKHRPLGCRIFPFDPTFGKDDKLRRLKLIDAAECHYELDGDNDVDAMRDLHARHEAETHAFQDRVATWNREQQKRKRAGAAPQTARAFFEFLGF